MRRHLSARQETAYDSECFGAAEELFAEATEEGRRSTLKHYIIVKFREGTDVQAAAVRELFEGTLSIPGIRGVDVRTSCSSRPNRFDMMIVIDMDAPALPAYDVSEPHLRWKAEYGPLIEKKAIFDCEG